MKRVSEDIYAVEFDCPFTLTGKFNLYYIEGEAPAIIDTGLGDENSMRRITEELKRSNRALEDVCVLINTHEHIEHFGGNQKIRDVSGAMVVASERSASFIEDWKGFIGSLKASAYANEHTESNLLQAALTFHESIEGSEVENRVKDGDSIELGDRRLEVLATPGHATGHICLYDPERRILFSGDNLVPEGATFVGFGWHELVQGNLGEMFDGNSDEPSNLSLYLQSLKRLLELDIETILPAHSAPVTEPHEKVRQAISRKERKEELVFEIVRRRGEIELYALTAEAYPGKQINFLNLGATIGYLEDLSKTGKIRAEVAGETMMVTVN